MDAEEFHRRNVDPTIPIDGADPENIAGPFSNIELAVAAGKLNPPHDDDESIRLRPAHARQKAKSGDAITDSDARVNPELLEQVGEDNGEEARKEAGRTNVGRVESAPEGRAKPAKQTASGSNTGTSSSRQQTA